MLKTSWPLKIAQDFKILPKNEISPNLVTLTAYPSWRAIEWVRTGYAFLRQFSLPPVDGRQQKSAQAKRNYWTQFGNEESSEILPASVRRRHHRLCRRSSVVELSWVLAVRCYSRFDRCIKAHSHSPQQCADSALDCVNAEIGIC